MFKVLVWQCDCYLKLPSVGNGNLTDVPEMGQVTSLDLSYNHLQDLSAIGPAFPNLTSLNVAFNNINSVDSFQVRWQSFVMLGFSHTSGYIDGGKVYQESLLRGWSSLKATQKTQIDSTHPEHKTLPNTKGSIEALISWLTVSGWGNWYILYYWLKLNTICFQILQLLNIT